MAISYISSEKTLTTFLGKKIDKSLTMLRNHTMLYFYDIF